MCVCVCVCVCICVYEYVHVCVCVCVCVFGVYPVRLLYAPVRLLYTKWTYTGQLVKLYTTQASMSHVMSHVYRLLWRIPWDLDKVNNKMVVAQPSMAS